MAPFEKGKDYQMVSSDLGLFASLTDSCSDSRFGIQSSNKDGPKAKTLCVVPPDVFQEDLRAFVPFSNSSRSLGNVLIRAKTSMKASNGCNCDRTFY